MYDVVVLTDDRYAMDMPKPGDEYHRNVILEDQLVLQALKNHGLNAIKKSWSDPKFDWKTTKFALFRTTWDYAERFTEFTDWLIDVSTKTKLINSYLQIVWNLDKHYLRDLKEKDVHVVETYFVEMRDKRSLQEILIQCGWKKAVLKPVVSAAAKDTYLIDEDNASPFEERFSQLIQNEAMMLQPFQESVTIRGELSLMVIGGEYTHAVLKKAKSGDFRVQDDFGGTVHAYTPTAQEKELALATVRACEEAPLYARVDMVNDNNGKPAISELELIEPEMWFRRNEPAADQLAEAIKQKLA